MKALLTIKNYRCFLRPVQIEIRKGFLAFVGVNNAGKSTIMRFLLEFRPLFERVHFNSVSFHQSLQGGDNFAPLHVFDSEEIFSNRNEEGLEFWLDFVDVPQQANPKFPQRVSFNVQRNMRWQTTLRTDAGQLQISNSTPISVRPPTLLHYGSATPSIDLRLLYEVAAALAKTLYVGPFRNTINVGTKTDYLDIQIGESFIQQFKNLKTGKSKKNSAAMTQLTDDIRKIFEYDSFNIEASEDNQSLHITVNGKSYKQHELGSGLFQFILVLVNASIKKPNFILIDEPELNLHPRLQLDFLTTLGTYATHGVWFSTHSVGLARSAAEKIYSVRRKGDGDSSIEPLESVPRLSEFLGEMSFSSHKELGFEKILLVEGPTEVKTIQQVLRKMSKDHKFVLLPLHGRIIGDMAEEIEEVMRISTNVAALIDSERKSENHALDKNRQAFVDLCKAKGISCHVLQYRATENYFPDSAVKEVLGINYRALQPYEKLKDATPNWSKSQNWKLAAAMSLDDIKKTDFGAFLNDL